MTRWERDAACFKGNGMHRPQEDPKGALFHSPSCLCNACIVGVNAHGFFKSGGSGNLWCIFSIFPVTLFFLPLSVFLPTMHRFTCKLLSVVCGECTKFKHINKHFNFQIVSSLCSWARFNSPSSHHVLPNPQDLSLAVRRMYRY